MKVKTRSFCKEVWERGGPVNINNGVSFAVDIVMRWFVFVFVSFFTRQALFWSQDGSIIKPQWVEIQE